MESSNCDAWYLISAFTVWATETTLLHGIFANLEWPYFATKKIQTASLYLRDFVIEFNDWLDWIFLIFLFLRELCMLNKTKPNITVFALFYYANTNLIEASVDFLMNLERYD